MRTPLALALSGLLIAVFFAINSALQIAMGPVAARFLWRHRRRHGPQALPRVEDTALPLVSILVPAHNRERTVVDSVRALLAIEYEPCEVVVINDGSTDATLDALSRAFDLVAAPAAFGQPIATAPIQGCYRSIPEPRLIVLDKDGAGCKADAVNAGINASSGSLVLVIDADTVLDQESISRAVLPFLEDPHTVAVGGHVGVTNGCRLESGRVIDVALPRNWLARYQVIEHLRTLLLFRLACASRNAVVLMSGAFGMFQRRALIAIGGYDATAIGDDMDLTIRLQTHYRDRGEPFRIAFDPNPLGWTQVPENGASFRSERCRWRRGLMQVLWRHRRLIGNARYGLVGLAVMPYLLIFEGVGPLLEITGYGITIFAGLAGLAQWPYFAALSATLVLLAMVVTLFAVMISDLVTQRYMRNGDLVSLVIVAITESIGYRQWGAWLSCVGTYQALLGAGGGAAMSRRAFGWVAVALALASS
jgi:cellulose synthase/poly-beta-1,6-N-acetylglucosamine synthase-like glycosyltransferase